MSYKNLRKFRNIFKRDDFSYISSLARIQQIIDIILYSVPKPDGNEETYIMLLQSFHQNLNSFYEWINGNSCPDIKEGYLITQQELTRIINILKMPESEQYKRTAIRQRHLSRFIKLFLYGLLKIYKGIRAIFQPEIIKTIGMNDKQKSALLVRYILDNIEGLGTKYRYHSDGEYSFTRKISTLSLNELITTERLLLRLPPHLVRMSNGWIDIGAGDIPVRILIKPSTLMKDTVCFLFRNNDTEKRAYSKMLRTPADTVKV